MLIGSDIGTSGTKTVIFDLNGNALASDTQEYPLYQPQNGWAEQEPEDWWKAVYTSIKNVIAKSGAKPSDIKGIGLSGQMHGLVMLDKNDKVLRRSIIWCDQRTQKECDEITSIVGREKLIEITANPALTGFTASKLRWVMNNEPEIFAKCTKVMLPKDYIRYMLTGEFATEVSDASGMQFMDIKNRTWSKELLDMLGIDIGLLPKMYESYEISGKINKYAAELTKVVEAAQKDAAAKGGELDADFHCIVKGKPLASVRRLSKEEIDLIVRRVARIVKIGMFMDRYPAELSGGQQQRVAIARTLAPQPGVLFMDEPLSNLDAKLRLEMRSELQRLHHETGSTFVYVTHDQMEAMTLATKICLIDNGVLAQYDPPLKVYNEPNNTFVADFVGNPVINFVNAKGKQVGDNIELEILDGVKAIFKPNEALSMTKWRKDLSELLAAKAAAEAEKAKKKGYVEKQNKEVPFNYHVALVDEIEDYGDEVVLTDEDYVLGIRPEFVTTEGSLEGEVYSSMPTGMETTLRIAIGNNIITGVMFGGVVYNLGDKVKVGFKGNNVVLFDRKTGRRIALGSLELA